MGEVPPPSPLLLLLFIRAYVCLTSVVLESVKHMGYTRFRLPPTEDLTLYDDSADDADICFVQDARGLQKQILNLVPDNMLSVNLNDTGDPLKEALAAGDGTYAAVLVTASGWGKGTYQKKKKNGSQYNEDTKNPWSTCKL